MNNVMNHKFTLREIILMIVLAVALFVGLYFLLVFYPVNNRIDELDAQIAKVQREDAEAADDLTVYNSMKKAVDDIKQIPENERSYMHESTLQEGMDINNDFGRILGDMQTSGSISITELGGGVIQRRIHFTFSVSTATEPTAAYDKVMTLLTELMSCGNRRCQLGNITLTPNGGDLESATEISVSADITFYELKVQQ